MHPYVDMAVILRDAVQRGADLVFRAFEPLQIDVGAADQRPGDAIALVQAAGIQKDAVQDAASKPKGREV